MVNIGDLIERVGAAVLRAVTLPDSRHPALSAVRDIVIAEPDRRPCAAEGDVVLGIGIADREGAVALIRACGDHQAAAVLLKPPLSTDDSVVRAAASSELALVEVTADTAWAQLLWLIRAARDGAEVDSGSAGLNDLFRLADAVADIVDAPVTIEDAQSRVLAYSQRQDLADEARVSTIMGRRQPDEVLAKFRTRGTFRQLSKGNSVVYVPAQQDGTLPRLVVPIRMGGELLGSMWAVVPGEVPAERSAAFGDTASLIALKLLQWRAAADIERHRATKVTRVLLEHGEDWRSAATELGVPSTRHRVLALGMAASDDSAEATSLALWDWVTRRIGSRHPVTEIGRTLYVLVPDRPGPGGWPALRKALATGNADPNILVAAGAGVDIGDLPRSRAQADEVLALLRDRQVRDSVAVHEELWNLVVLHRLAQATAGTGVGSLGPLPILREHDRTQGTEYLRTLYAWLRHPGDPRAASEELHIHPNTLRYRMHRLTTLVDLDLSDPDIRSALLIQLLVES